MSMEEFLDIVDENCQVLYQATKTEAHQKGLLHQTVIGEVIDSQGRKMLVKQSSTRQDAGQYVSPVGGHVKAGETTDEALKREAMEELGIKGFPYKLVGKAIFQRVVLGRDENHYFIVYEITSDHTPQFNEEADGFEHFTQEQLRQELKENPKKFGGACHFVARTFYPELQ